MRTRTTLGFLAILGFTSVQANLLTNGGFEINTAAGNMDNMSNATWNATVGNSTAYGGSNELDLYDASAAYGPTPCEGLWKAAMHSQAGTALTDAFTLEFSSALTVGNTYKLSFCAVANDDFSSGPGALDLGISTTAGTFGTGVYSTAVATGTTWTLYSTTFVASIAATHLSVETAVGNSGWSHVDDFKVEVVPEPATMAALGVGALGLLRRRKRN